MAKEKKQKKEKKSINSGEIYKYDAFISYRHIQPDKAIAENLHKQLENFKLPKNVNATLENGHTKIERVFRDEDELPIASSLEDAIVNALQNSEWLIVICSPRILESAWCRLEISTFIRLHGRDHVLAVLVEGEPDEAIPEELLYEEVTTYNALGVPETTKRRVEPLACDIRDKSTKKMIKNLQSQKLRLLAQMFNLNYDDLRQRHREKAMRRRLKLVSIAAAVLLVIFLISAVGLIAVYLQNQKINEQNIKLEEQAMLIADQNTNLLRSQAINTANNSLVAYEADDRHQALQLAYDSLTTVDDNEMPYTSVGYRALAQALNVYSDTSIVGSFTRLWMPGSVARSELSDDGMFYFAMDDLGNLYIWNTVTLANVGQLTGLTTDYYTSTNISSFLLLNNNKVMYITEDGIHQYDYTSYQDSLVKPGSYTGLTYSRSNNYVAAYSMTSQSLDIIDADTTSVVHTFSGSDLLAPIDNSNIVTEEDEEAAQEPEIIEPTAFSDYSVLYAWAVQDHIVYSVGDFWGGDVVYLRVIDLNDMSITSQFEIPCSDVEKAMIINDSLYYIAHTSDDAFHQQEFIGRIDLTTNELVWQVEREGYSSVLKCATMSIGEVIITYSMNRIWVINAETGEIIGDESGFDFIVYLGVGDDFIYFVTSDNFAFSMSLSDGTFDEAIGFYYVGSSMAGITTTERVNIGSLECFVGRDNDNYVYVYRDINNPDLTPTNDASTNLGVLTYRDLNGFDSIIENLNSEEPLSGVNSVLSCNNDSVVVTNMSNNTFNLFVDNEFVGNYNLSYITGPYYVAMNMDSYYGTDSEGNYYFAHEGWVGFRISPDGEIMAVIDGLSGYDSSTNSVIRYIDGSYYSQPVYSVDELIDMAEVALGAY
ncbi:MAG: toll/interleukin-1 receptor domain-containing protein [Saccharofermentans sp.]|nr:toll/interleukin-1 receptor domain-containing protein [Saccharofermentans sp.]